MLLSSQTATWGGERRPGLEGWVVLACSTPYRWPSDAAALQVHLEIAACRR
jgi:hypothetical protein